MIAAVGPDRAWAYYLTLGMVATVNPCGFAMLPAYLSFFLGLGDDDGPGVARASVARAVRVGAAVSAGFLAVFALAGLAVELTPLPVYENAPWISIVIGVALLALGIAMLAGYEPRIALPRLDRGGRERTVASMFVFGVSYAIASIGCTLPLFLGAVAGTITRESVVDGMVVFAIYALGMTLVLMALTVTMALARTSLVRFLRRAQPYIPRVAGGLVALAGAYVAWYGWLEIRTTRAEPGELPSSGITDRVAGWSSSITDWVERVGSVRLALIVVLLLVAVGAGLRYARERRDHGASRSMRQPDAEAGVAPVDQPVVLAPLPLLPELHALGHHPHAAPVRRPPHLAPRQLGLGISPQPFERGPVGDDLALRRRQRSDLAAPGPRGPVGVRRRVVHPGRLPLDDHLPARRMPREQQRHPGIGRQLAALAALVVGEEHEPAGVERPHEHVAHRGTAVRRGGSDHHRLRFAGRHLPPGREPPPELLDRIGSEVVGVHGAGGEVRGDESAGQPVANPLSSSHDLAMTSASSLSMT